MIPVSLNPRNFMCYTDVHEPLRFEGIQVAVLSGENGHGKSALLDAITWALWGESRARTVDDLIHTGATEMEVEFEFILDEEQYRVIRKRQRRGRSGTSDLQFAVLAAGTYRPLTERSLGETERAIRETLRMSYETFTNSSFIQQGKADSFTLRPPVERKRILAEILELGYFDTLEAAAREAFRERELMARDERVRAREWETEIAERPAREATLAAVVTQHREAQARATEIEADWQSAREHVARLETSERALKETRERLQRSLVEAKAARARADDAAGQLSRAETVIARAPAIEAAAAELTALRATLESLDAQFRKYVPLARARRDATSALEAERARIETSIKALTKQVAEHTKAAEKRGQLEAELTEATRAARELALVEAARAQAQEAQVRCREESAEKRLLNAQLLDQMKALRARLDDLEKLVTCPECLQPLTPAHKSRLRADYRAAGERLREQYRDNERQCKALDVTLAQHDAELARIAGLVGGRAAAERRVATAESALQQANEAGDRLAKLQAELAQHEEALQREHFAPEVRRRLAEVDEQLASLSYDEVRHEHARLRAAEFAPAEGEKRALDEARLTVMHVRPVVAETRERLERLGMEIAADEATTAKLATEVGHVEAVRRRLRELEPRRQAATLARDELRTRQAQAEGALERCDVLAGWLAESNVRRDAHIREQQIFSDLAAAFGKRGVQAMIIDTAIPEIEEEANRILSRITSGRMHVAFETQRDTRTGSGPVETLDIRIADELGTRGYEMFSGGESFRVNFAIRLALSKLLARRAGTRLQTLVIDEGFGSQDADGRDRLVEAIQAIQDEFSRILIVTHLDDLRDRFPVQIEVRKTPAGSVIGLR